MLVRIIQLDIGVSDIIRSALDGCLLINRFPFYRFSVFEILQDFFFFFRFIDGPSVIATANFYGISFGSFEITYVTVCIVSAGKMLHKSGNLVVVDGNFTVFADV